MELIWHKCPQCKQCSSIFLLKELTGASDGGGSNSSLTDIHWLQVRDTNHCASTSRTKKVRSYHAFSSTFVEHFTFHFRILALVIGLYQDIIICLKKLCWLSLMLSENLLTPLLYLYTVFLNFKTFFSFQYTVILRVFWVQSNLLFTGGGHDVETVV